MQRRRRSDAEPDVDANADEQHDADRHTDGYADADTHLDSQPVRMGGAPSRAAG